jgi:seryl-tRNA(Sec) selenium transferase
MKVGKEEIMGLLAAVERYLKVDHEAERREVESRAGETSQILSEIKGVKTDTFVPEVANQVPHLAVEWDQSRTQLTSQQVSDLLLKGDPCIELGRENWRRPEIDKDTGQPRLQGLTVCVWTLRPGEPKIVGRRLREILTGAACS